MKNATLLTFAITVSLLFNVVHSISGYLFKKHQEESIEAKPLIAVFDDPNEKSCLIKLQSNERVNDKHVVYSGNGFNYDIGCSINDPHSEIGDKYYVIDLVVYGPNTRVAKAWREQFKISKTNTGTTIALDKTLSFYWLGVSNIVCSVQKYNGLKNKFSQICQTNDQALVKENPLLKVLRQEKTKIITTEPKIAESERAEITKSNDKIFSPNDIDDSINPDDNTQNKTSIKDNLNVRAMQYRDLFKASDIKKHNTISKSESSSSRLLIQPIMLALMFVFIFCLSIGTIAYLSYNQRLTREYQSVNIHASGDQVQLSKFNKRPKSYAIEMTDIINNSETNKKADVTET